jgi:hypothetical protein
VLGVVPKRFARKRRRSIYSPAFVDLVQHVAMSREHMRVFLYPLKRYEPG